MLVRPTVFILGAGSSVQFGLPVGTGLADSIARRLAVDPSRPGIRDQPISETVDSVFGEEIDAYIAAAERVSRGVRSFRSIDDFLYSHSDDERMVMLGKLGIARAITQAEQESFLSKLWSRRPEEHAAGLEQLRTTWAQPLIQLLATNCRRSDVHQLFDEVSFVNFNYDRCIETVLFHGIQPAFAIDAQEAAAVMEKLKIYRPYGGLGDLRLIGGKGTPFGDVNARLIEMARRVRVYTEEMGEREDLVEMRDRLGRASKVVALGFAFHRQNMQLLDLDAAIRAAPRDVYATTYGESAPARQEMFNRIKANFGETGDRAVLQATLDCSALMNDYYLALAS